MNVGQKFELNAIDLCEFLVGKGTVGADTDDCGIRLVERRKTVVECTHFFVANTAKGSWIESKNDFLSPQTGQFKRRFFRIDKLKLGA